LTLAETPLYIPTHVAPPSPARRTTLLRGEVDPLPEPSDYPDTPFSLRPGVRLEPLGDGTAVLFANDLDQSLSLNHTAALLCSFADGQHTLSAVVQEMGQIFPDSDIDVETLAACLLDLKARRFLQWE
jgi:hypothetical protein